LFISAVIISFFLQRRKAAGDFYFKEVLAERKNNKNWKRIVDSHIFQGLREGIFAFVITIWVYLITKSELSLGMLNLYFSGFAFVFYFVATKLITPVRRIKIIIFGRLLIYISFFFFFF